MLGYRQSHNPGETKWLHRCRWSVPAVGLLDLGAKPAASARDPLTRILHQRQAFGRQAFAQRLFDDRG
jgi:hypothetical protein